MHVCNNPTWQLLQINLQIKRFWNDLNWKHNRRRSLNSRCEQEEWLQYEKPVCVGTWLLLLVWVCLSQTPQNTLHNIFTKKEQKTQNSSDFRSELSLMLLQSVFCGLIFGWTTPLITIISCIFLQAENYLDADNDHCSNRTLSKVRGIRLMAQARAEV